MFNGKTHYKWAFSIAILVYQRVYKIKAFGQKYGTVFPHSHEIRLKGKDDDSPWLTHRFWLKFLRF
jgi:hypothetical protein